MHRTSWRLAPTMLFLVVAWNSGDAFGEPPSPAERLTVLKRDFGTTWDKYKEQLNAAKDEDSYRKVSDQLMKDVLPLVQQGLELAERHPNDPAAFDALAWIRRRCAPFPKWIDRWTFWSNVTR